MEVENIRANMQPEKRHSRHRFKNLTDKMLIATIREITKQLCHFEMILKVKFNEEKNLQTLAHDILVAYHHDLKYEMNRRSKATLAKLKRDSRKLATTRKA